MNNPILIPMTVSSDQVTYEMSVGDSQQTFSMSCETSINYIRGRLQEKEATPSEQIQSITPDADYDALSLVTVDAIPSTYVGSDVPRQTTLSASGNTVTASAGYYENNVSQSVQSGSATTPTGGITANPSISIDANGKITASVNKSESITPIVQEGYVTSGTAGAITFSGSAEHQMTKRTSSDLSASGATVTAPSGYYPSNATKTISSGTEGTPSATKGIVSNHSVSVTPKVTNTAGYISGGTHTGTSVTVSASELVSGAKNITSNGESDVTNYQKVNVAVPAPTPVLETQTKSYTPTESQQTETLTPSSGYDGIGEVDVTVGAIDSDYVGSGITRRSTLSVSGDTVTAQAGYYENNASASVASGSAGTPTATKGTVSNHSISVTPSVANTTGYITGGTKAGTAVTVSASELVSGTYSVTSSGTKDVTNYASASVPSGTEGTPTATKGTVTNHSVSVTPSVTNTGGFISGTTKTGTAVTVSASELVSGSQNITSNNTYDVTNLAEVVVNVSGGAPVIDSLNVTPTTSQQTFNSSSVDGYKPVVVNAMPSGSATPAASISATGATVSTGTNTITLTKSSVSNTPQVSAGYVSSGTAGNSSVSLTASVTTIGATNHYATTSDQTIASGTYLTGTQTIKALSQTNLTADNIKSGTTITINNGNANVWSVLGTYTGGGGGTDRLVLLQTTSLGALSTTSTSATSTNKTVSLASSTNWDDYDLLIVDISVDTITNNRHTSSVSFVINTGTTSVSTKNTYTVGSNVWNSKLGSTGTASSRQSTSKYGIYVNSASVSSSTLSLPIYYRYNSNNTGTINGNYTARVYGINLIDLVGG